jgi:hypothetical protein
MARASETIVISAGRNVLTEPMGEESWEYLKLTIETMLANQHAIIVTNRALGVGQYQGMSEESVTYVALVHNSSLGAIEEALAAIARLYKQESIALMIVESTKFC